MSCCCNLDLGQHSELTSKKLLFEKRRVMSALEHCFQLPGKSPERLPCHVLRSREWVAPTKETFAPFQHWILIINLGQSWKIMQWSTEERILVSSIFEWVFPLHTESWNYLDLLSLLGWPVFQGDTSILTLFILLFVLSLPDPTTTPRALRYCLSFKFNGFSLVFICLSLWSLILHSLKSSSSLLPSSCFFFPPSFSFLFCSPSSLRG